MLEGTLIAESLRPGTTLDEVTLTVRKIVRHAPSGITEDQPPIWTNIDFEIADSEGDTLASAETRQAEPGHRRTDGYLAFLSHSWTGRSDPAGLGPRPGY